MANISSGAMDTRERILQATARVYAQHGFRGATTRLIAIEAGVNEVSLFRTFGSKAALFEAMMQSHASSLPVPELPDIPGDAHTEITAWCAALLAHMRQWRSIIRKSFGELEERPEAAVVMCEGPNCAAAALAALRGAARAGSTRRLSRDDALRAAEVQSEAVQIARAGLTRAKGQWYQARSQYLPQLSAVLSYQRTLRSQFQGVSLGGSPDTSTTPKPQSVCAPSIPANATQAQVQAALAQASTCQAATGGFNFSSVGFGAPNSWTAGINFSQNVFAGGRISAQYQAANASVNAATIEIAAQRAQLALDVTQAYYDAALADRLVSIQEAALSQTDEVLRQTRVARQVGNQAEFDLLRAQVTRDNQVPVVLQARNTRQVAYYRLKQLLNLPMDEALDLATPLDDSTAAMSTVPAAVNAGSARAQTAGLAAALVPDTNASDRAPVRQLQENVRAQQGLVRAARGERLPTVQITSGYQRLYFPTSVFPQLNNARENWTIGVSASLPLFTGFRIKGDEMVAQGNLEQAK